MFNAVGVGKGVSANFVEVGEKRTGVLVAMMISGVIVWGITVGRAGVSCTHNWLVGPTFNPQAVRNREPVTIKRDKANLKHGIVFLDMGGFLKCVRLVIN